MRLGRLGIVHISARLHIPGRDRRGEPGRRGASEPLMVFFAPGWLVAGRKWGRRALTKAASARSLKCLSSSEGNADASGGAFFHLKKDLSTSPSIPTQFSCQSKTGRAGIARELRP